MKTNNSNNEIAAVGYSTREAFFTVHANGKGIYTINDIPGKITYQSEGGYNRIKQITPDYDDPYMSLSVYRTDIGAGNTHVSEGMIRNVFIPVSVRGECIYKEHFAFVFSTAGIYNKFYVRMERMSNIHNINDIKRLVDEINTISKNEYDGKIFDEDDFNRTELTVGEKKIIIITPGHARAEIQWHTATGKRIIACAEVYGKCRLASKLGLGIDASGALPEQHFRKIYVDGIWYDYTYVADHIVITKESNPETEYTINGEKYWILSKIVDNRNLVICKINTDGSGNVDYIVPKETYMKPNFNTIEYVIRSSKNHYSGSELKIHQ